MSNERRLFHWRHETEGFVSFPISHQMLLDPEISEVVLMEAVRKYPSLPDSIIQSADVLAAFHTGVDQKITAAGVVPPRTRLYSDKQKRFPSFFYSSNTHELMIRTGVLDYFSTIPHNSGYRFYNSFDELLFEGTVLQYARYIGMEEGEHAVSIQTGVIRPETLDSMNTSWLHLVEHDALDSEYLALQHNIEEMQGMPSFTEDNIRVLQQRVQTAQDYRKQHHKE